MEEILFWGVFRSIIKFVGATFRWIYGSIWRTIFGKPKFTFKEYLYGPKSPNYYDKLAHGGNNLIIGFIVILLMVFALIKLFE
ncbi:hypothetical protein [Hwangdonia lutea]|uniref:Uncharacterized protein n=1 Tax=Hwangdonia lutea TaxID=3075823 RepID=A0AA97HP71_9FLAO|nr:hypothetical protein [Hwangdonia sp. SCSIO 19198]WOD42317.1 hypothetical protein RNZ46_09935 [Hwangdonia sp. SCSIO 19198]